jgi:uncharacterized membrane protein YozB (DUF420 family)
MYQDLVTNSQHSDQQNAQYCFLDIYILKPHKTFVHVLIPKGWIIIRKRTKAILHKTQLVSFNILFLLFIPVFITSLYFIPVIYFKIRGPCPNLESK